MQVLCLWSFHCLSHKNHRQGWWALDKNLLGLFESKRLLTRLLHPHYHWLLKIFGGKAKTSTLWNTFWWKKGFWTETLEQKLLNRNFWTETFKQKLLNGNFWTETSEQKQNSNCFVVLEETERLQIHYINFIVVKSKVWQSWWFEFCGRPPLSNYWAPGAQEGCVKASQNSWRSSLFLQHSAPPFDEAG